MALSIISCTSQNREKDVKTELTEFIYKQRGLDTITMPHRKNWTVKERKKYVSSDFGLLKTLKYRDLKITSVIWGPKMTDYRHYFLYFHHRKKNDNILQYQLEDDIRCAVMNDIPCSDSAYAIRVEEHISTNSFIFNLNDFIAESTKGLTRYERTHVIDFIFEICLDMKKVVPHNTNWLVEKMAKKLDNMDSWCPCCSSNIKENSAKLFFMSLRENCSIYETQKDNGYLQVIIDPVGNYPIKHVKLLNYECISSLMLF